MLIRQSARLEAALVIVALTLRERRESWRGKSCRDAC
jgi:hypothetical protein